MKKVDAVLAALGLALLIGIQLIPDHPEMMASEVTITGDDPVLIAAVAYPPSADRNVESIICDASALTKTMNTGSLSGVRDIEIWYQINPSIGDLPITVTMTEDCAGEMSMINLKDVDQTTPFAGQLISVGQDIATATLDANGGDATLIIVFSSPASKTLSAPSGFEELENRLGNSDVRIASFFDDDASESSAELSFSGAVDFTAYTLGVNLAE